MWSLTTSVSKRSACFWKRAISSGPITPSASAGQLSTSVVVISWPPWASPGNGALGEPGHEDRAKIGARRVYCRRVAGGTGSQDEQAGVLDSHRILVHTKPKS